jgi:hypothetical protein
MNRPTMIITDNSVAIGLNKKLFNIQKEDPRFQPVMEAIRKEQWDQLEVLCDTVKAVIQYTKGLVKIENDTVYYDGSVVPSAIEKRILALMKEGISFDYIIKFYERLKNNPSSSSVKELYDFLENKNIPIDHEGYFYAYKAIRQDWKDIYTGTVSNEIGQKPTMLRNKVDDNRNIHCSHGYHVGSLEYVRYYGGQDCRIVICKVDPADVVSVPNDHNCQKVRVCSYEVVSEFVGTLPETIWTRDTQYNGDEWEFEDYFEEIIEDQFEEEFDEIIDEEEVEEDEIFCEICGIYHKR